MRSGFGENWVTGQLALFEAAEGLALEDFPAALAALNEQKDSSERAQLLSLWAERDLAGAVKWFAAQPPKDQQRLFWFWSETWARLDADGVRAWLKERPPEERPGLEAFTNQKLVGILADRNAEVTLELCALYPKLLPPYRVLETWAKRDPVTAAKHALDLPPDESRSSAIHFVTRAWTHQDPQAALDWINQLDEPADAFSARNALLMIYAGADPAAAAEMVRTKFSGAEQTDQWRMVAAFGAGKDPEAVIAWAQNQSDPDVRRTMVAEAVRQMAQDSKFGGTWPPPDPNMPHCDAHRIADLWLEESAASGKALGAGDSVAASLASQYGLAEAMRFLDQAPPSYAEELKNAPDAVGKVVGWPAIADAAVAMPPGQQRTGWLERAVSGLLREGNVDRVQAIIDQLPASTERNGVIAASATALFSDDPTSGAELLLTLPNGTDRLQSALRDWIKSDRREALRWINTTAILSAEDRASLLTPHPEKAKR